MGAKKLSTIFRENLTEYGKLFPAGNEKENESIISTAGFTTPEEVIEWANDRHYTMKRYSNILSNYVEEFTTKILKEKVFDLLIARSSYYSFLSKLFNDSPITCSLSIDGIKRLLEVESGFPGNIPDLALIAKNSEILNERYFNLDELIDMNCYLLFNKEDMSTQIANRRSFLMVRDELRDIEP